VYSGWKGLFFPESLSQRHWLEFYQGHFDTVELNVTFYRLPREAVFAGWAERAPAQFRFAVKGPRLITHFKRLRDVGESVELFLARARLLGDHLGPILWQLPPNLSQDRALLVSFLEHLPEDLTHAFEFRHPSWYAEPVYKILRGHRSAFVMWHMRDTETPLVVTSSTVYVRFHGTTARYGGGYADAQLARWAWEMRGWLEEGGEVWAYFNNDFGGHAVRDARRLRDRLARSAGVSAGQ
jgi:uncharacterized protein YecE (DUF72 family)